jgi:CheY-like chemotaxis protein
MPITVLIVDDSKLARIVAGKALTALQPDWQRIEAASAADAAPKLVEHQIDVALLDYNMPGKNGLDLAAELRARYPTMPIAVITANVQDEIIAQARAVNAAFITKPLTEDGLRGFLSAAALQLRGGNT